MPAAGRRVDHENRHPQRRILHQETINLNLNVNVLFYTLYTLYTYVTYTVKAPAVRAWVAIVKIKDEAETAVTGEGLMTVV